MRTIKNLKVVNNVLHKELPNIKFGIFDVMVISKEDNIKKLYIGNKNKFDKTLFRQSKDTECYYDILDNEELYYSNLEKLYESDSENYCTNLESLLELTKKYKSEKR